MAKRSLSGEKSDFFQKNGLPLSLSLLLKEGIGNCISYQHATPASECFAWGFCLRNTKSKRCFFIFRLLLGSSEIRYPEASRSGDRSYKNRQLSVRAPCGGKAYSHSDTDCFQPLNPLIRGTSRSYSTIGFRPKR